jgi:Skp family chaperone for outer membrane proteins
MKIPALIAVLLLAVSARAIELSLEENRGERGSVGYVDMQRLFTNSPDSQRAKEGFEELVRQAEERVNLRKAELLKLRQELEATRVERDALAHSMSLAPAPSAPPPSAAAPAPAAPAAAAPAAPATAPAAAPAAAPAPPSAALSPAAAALLAQSNSTAPATSPASPSASRVHDLALPGMATTDTAPFAAPAAAPKAGVPSSDGAAAVPGAAPAPAASPAAATAAKPSVPSSDGAAAVPPPAKPAAAAPAVSSAAVSAAAGMFPAAPAPAPVAKIPAGPTPAQRLLEIDSKIISIQADIAHKEAELTQEHDEADRGLLDVESRKTDQVLARLYRAVTEVARREGVSVVIDKTTILYGHPAVDLTDKVLKYLDEKSKEAPAP